MKTLIKFIFITALMSITVSVLRCGDGSPKKGETSITPGVGVTMQGESINIGASLEALESAFSSSLRLRDMENAGVHFTITSKPITGFLSSSTRLGEVTEIILHPDFGGSTPNGVSIGSDRAAVTSEFGEPEIDPFRKGWWYPSQGIGFEWDDVAVSRIHIFRPL